MIAFLFLRYDVIMHPKVVHVPRVEGLKFENLGPTIREVRMNKLKVNKAKKFSQLVRK